MCRMKTYFIIAHPDSQSFNHELLQYLCAVCKEYDCEYRINDLYQSNFDPVLRLEEIEEITRNQVPEDIKTEQQNILWADTVVLISPLWWGSFPAILKGYFDKILTHGFAFHADNGFTFPNLKNNLLNLQTAGNVATRPTDHVHFKGLPQQYDYHLFHACGFKSTNHIFQGIPSRHNSVYLNILTRSKEALLKIITATE